jgi:L-serine dehydratase
MLSWHEMISLFDLFKIGIGPSSSHTMGPMRAAAEFVRGCEAAGALARTDRVRVTLLGSLAWTGKGHASDKAVVLGLAGIDPATIDPDAAGRLFEEAVRHKILALNFHRAIEFDVERDIVFDGVSPAPRHPNTLRFEAFDTDGRSVAAESWCSVGGGFVVREDEAEDRSQPETDFPFPFRTAKELLALGDAHRLSIADMVMANERALRTDAEIEAGIAAIDGAMMACVDRGLRAEGILPGGLHVKRRARVLLERLTDRQTSNQRMPHEAMDWVSLYAIAVNEENAAGGRVVTAPTNGASGVIPAVLRYYHENHPAPSADGVRIFLLTAAAIGGLIKRNASISGAEVGCQGEVGAACSMAAAGLAAALGGTNGQIENAAEIGMEHHLGMTCDPIGGLVQIPCIERNAFGAVKAISAASLALHGDGEHHVTLDRVIATMRETGADMQAKYKETSNGGLAVNRIDC